MVLKMFSVWSLQPRLLVITETLVASIAPLIELACTILPVLLLLSALGTICFGEKVPQLRDAGTALTFVSSFMVTGKCLKL